MIRYTIGLLVVLILSLGAVVSAHSAQASMSFNLSQYKLGSGDVIQIKVFGQLDLLLKTRLSNDGMINYPLLGEISVVGMTANELEIFIYKGLLGDYLVNPSVAVSIEEYRPFFIDGEVNRPGGYPYQPGLTIDKAAALAGGYTQRASKTEVEVIREIGGVAQAIEVNATQFIYPGDSIKVKKTFFKERSDMDAKMDDTLFYNHSIDVSQYWRAVTRNKWAILAFAIVMSLVVSLFVLAMTPLYQSSTTLLIETESTNVMSIEEVYGFDSSRREYYLTQYEILRSRQIAERVVKRLNLTTHPLFDYEQLAKNQSGFASSISSIKKLVKTAIPLFPDPQEVVLTDTEKQQNKLDFAIAKLQANIDIKPVFHTHVVEIEFVSEDPLLAATISDTVANVYIENYLEAKLEMTAKATTWLNTSLAGLKNNLIKSEQALNAFYEKEKLVNIDGVIGLASEELQRYTALFVDAQNNLARVRSIFEQVNGQESKQDLASLQEVQNHPTVQNVKKQQLNAQSRVSELAKVYGPRHPKMIAANAELESIDDSLSRQVRALVDGIYQEYQAAESKVNSLKVEVESAKQNYRKLSNLENQHLALQREVEINNQLYSSFFTRLKETNEIGGFERANARILDAAKPALLPFKPRKAMLILLAFVASLLLAISAAIIKDTLNRGIRSVEDVERKLNQKMLGLLPLEKVKRKSSLPVRHFFADEHHVFSEAIRTLRTSLQFTNLEKSSQTMLVTSSVPKEGKSTVAINLGFAFSQLAMVLLIDADMRRPSIGKQFNLAGFQPGLSNLIAKTHELSECLCIDEESGLHILPAGTIPPNPQELLSSERFTRIMSVLKQKYQYIIIDSAPTQAVSDAMVLAKTADSIVYVVKANDTDEGLINNGISRFLMNGKRVDGVVLNQVDIHRADKYGEFAGYYDRYDYQS